MEMCLAVLYKAHFVSPYFWVFLSVLWNLGFVEVSSQHPESVPRG